MSLKATAAPFAAISIVALVGIYAVPKLVKGSGMQKPSNWRIWLARTLGRGSFVLDHVRIPIAVMPPLDSTLEVESDEEGFIECRILIKSGKIAGVSPSTPASGYTKLLPLGVVDCQGAIVVPCFSDAHTHLVKTQVVPRLRNISGTWGEALGIEVNDHPNWALQGDVFRRMDFAAQCALHHGTRAIRTHLDGCESEDPIVREAVYGAFDAIRDKYGPDDLVVQGVANLYLPLWTTPMAKKHAERAKSHANVVLGAYCGNSADTPDKDTISAMDALFQYALELSMDVDLHIDESNDPRCCNLRLLCEALSKARKAGYTGRVVLGHCCTLSLQDKATQLSICQQLATLQAFVVSNPFTNLGLQDRIGTTPPQGAAIPTDQARTPQWRGLTLLQELRDAGVTVASASDNVRDHWYPYGDYDMLSVWFQAQAMGHLDTAPSEGSWADICTSSPATAMGVDFSLAVGEPADLVLFPSARRASELFARPQVDRIVLRHGKVLTLPLPEYSELDDLVAVKSRKEKA
jgi:cytosine/creatinine deaminase